MPDSPDLIHNHDSRKVRANGVTAPMPVITTRFIVNYFIISGWQ